MRGISTLLGKMSNTKTQETVPGLTAAKQQREDRAKQTLQGVKYYASDAEAIADGLGRMTTGFRMSTEREMLEGILRDLKRSGIRHGLVETWRGVSIYRAGIMTGAEMRRLMEAQGKLPQRKGGEA